MKVKRLIFSAIVIVITSSSLSAQDPLDFNDPAIAVVTEGSEVVSGHAVSLSIVGLEYSYERAMGGNWSLIARAGFPCALTSALIVVQNGASSYNFEWAPRPGIVIEPRYYTNLKQRYDKGKNTLNNCADFIGLQIKAYYAGRADVSAIGIYGFRRGGEHWFREYTGGIAFHTKWGSILPHLNFRIGYSF